MQVDSGSAYGNRLPGEQMDYISISVFLNVGFEDGVLDKQVSYMVTQISIVAGVFSSFGIFATNGSFNVLVNVVCFVLAWFVFCRIPTWCQRWCPLRPRCHEGGKWNRIWCHGPLVLNRSFNNI